MLLTSWAGGATTATSFAQAPDPSAEAKLHYEEGTKAYSLGEFPRAIAEFKAAYNAKADPVLLYNIAQSYRLAGDANQALFFYRSFLRNKPDAPGRKDVEKKIKELEKQIAETKATPAPAVAPAPTTASPTTPPAATAPAPVKPAVTPTNPPPAPAAPSTATAPVAPAPVQPLPAATTPPSTEPPPVSTLPPPAPSTSPAASSSATTLTASAQPAPEAETPFYKKWWFWTGVGVVAIIGIGIAANSRQKVPQDDFGGPYYIKF